MAQETHTCAHSSTLKSRSLSAYLNLLGQEAMYIFFSVKNFSCLL